jgi:sec-independent protein translocase protein TatC
MDERRLTIGEHLEELRGHVFRAVVYVAVAFVACLYWQEPLMAFVTAPHLAAIEEVSRARAAENDAARRARAEETLERARDLAAALRAAEDPALAARPEPERVALADRIARDAGALGRAETAAAGDRRLRFAGYSDPFFAHLKIALICALLLSSPLVVLEIWRFVAAGLYPHERRWVRIFGPLTFVCFAGGCAFGYFFLIPQTLEYLASYGSPDIFAAAVTIDGYLDLFIALTGAIGLVFELPLVMIFLALLGVATAAFLRHYRRHWILAATIIAAVITPTGDPWTLAIVTLPLVALYEIGILCVALMERIKPKESTCDSES